MSEVQVAVGKPGLQLPCKWSTNVLELVCNCSKTCLQRIHAEPKEELKQKQVCTWLTLNLQLVCNWSTTGLPNLLCIVPILTDGPPKGLQFYQTAQNTMFHGGCSRAGGCKRWGAAAAVWTLGRVASVEGGSGCCGPHDVVAGLVVALGVGGWRCWLWGEGTGKAAQVA